MIALTLFGGGWILGGVLAVAAALLWAFVIAIGWTLVVRQKPPVRRALPAAPQRKALPAPRLALPAAPDPQR